MRFLIVGYGSIGKRHVENLKKIRPDIEIILYRSRFQKLDGVKSYFDLDKALEQKPDAVFITNPTSMHVETALRAAKSGCNLFIEKPLSHNMDGVDELIDIIREKNLSVMIGYNMRYHPAIKKIKELLDKKVIGRVLTARLEVGQYLPDWRPGKDYRKLYSADKTLGGGVILDLSHEIDYLIWMLGEVSGVLCLSDRISDLEINTEDTAEILVKLKNNAIAGIHLDYLQRVPSRSCEIIGENGTIRWDLSENIIKFFSVKDGKWDGFSFDDDKNQMYIDEIRHFIDCIENKNKPLINEKDGKGVLEVVLAAKESAETGRFVEI